MTFDFLIKFDILMESPNWENLIWVECDMATSFGVHNRIVWMRVYWLSENVHIDISKPVITLYPQCVYFMDMRYCRDSPLPQYIWYRTCVCLSACLCSEKNQMLIKILQNRATSSNWKSFRTNNLSIKLTMIAMAAAAVSRIVV